MNGNACHDKQEDGHADSVQVHIPVRPDYIGGTEDFFVVEPEPGGFGLHFVLVERIQQDGILGVALLAKFNCLFLWLDVVGNKEGILNMCMALNAAYVLEVTGLVG
jgi:hypothetical protein